MQRRVRTGPRPRYHLRKESKQPEPLKPPDTNAQYTGGNNARAVAISYGWSQVQTLLFLQVPVISGIIAYISVNTPPYPWPIFVMLVAGCVLGYILHFTAWSPVSLHTYSNVFHIESQLAVLEEVDEGSLVKIFSGGRVSGRIGLGVRYAILWIGLVVWMSALGFVVENQYPGFSRGRIDGKRVEWTAEQPKPKEQVHGKYK